MKTTFQHLKNQFSSLKVIFTLTVFLFQLSASLAQSEFKKEWVTKVTAPNKWNDQNADLSLILIGDLKVIEMVDGTNGKSLWKFNIKEKLGVKEMENWWFLWAYEGQPVEIEYKKPKESNVTSVYLNPRTGEIQSSITRESLKEVKKPKSKLRYSDEAYDEATNTTVSLIYSKKTVYKHSGSEFEVTALASGGNSWSSTVKIKAASHLNRLLLDDAEPNIMLYAKISGDKVFLMGEGMTVLDLKTGNTLWTASFDYVQSSATSQEIGHAPLPIFDNEAVYYCDFSKGEHAIKKLDKNTGKLIWSNENFNKNDVISSLEIINNSLIVKFGGYILKAKEIYNANSGATTSKAEFEYEGNSDIRAFDATTGKQIWTAENISTDDKYSKSECSILTYENNLIACSPTTFYIIEPATGKVVHKAALAAKEIGKPQHIFLYQGNFIVQGDEGIASYDKSAKQNYAVSTGKRLRSEYKGDAFIVWTGKSPDDLNEFIRFDLATGKIYGKLKGTYKPRFDSTGDYFIRFDEQEVTKFKSN